MKILTADASQDDLTDADYRDIYDELRDGRSLRQFIVLVSSQFSPTRWSQWENRQRGLSRAMRDELRQAVGMDVLPATVADVVAEHVHPDATVAQVGDDETAQRVLLIACPDPVTVHWNGNGPEEVTQLAPSAIVTGVTRRKTRKRYYRPALPAELGRRAKQAGITNSEIAEAVRSLLDEHEKTQ